MKQKLSKFIAPLMVLAAFAIVVSVATAWTGPTDSFPGGNVVAPVNTGLTGQTKQGDFASLKNIVAVGMSIGNSLVASPRASFGCAGQGIGLLACFLMNNAAANTDILRAGKYSNSGFDKGLTVSQDGLVIANKSPLWINLANNSGVTGRNGLALLTSQDNLSGGAGAVVQTNADKVSFWNFVGTDKVGVYAKDGNFDGKLYLPTLAQANPSSSTTPLHLCLTVGGEVIVCPDTVAQQNHYEQVFSRNSSGSQFSTGNIPNATDVQVVIPANAQNITIRGVGAGGGGGGGGRGVNLTSLGGGGGGGGQAGEFKTVSIPSSSSAITLKVTTGAGGAGGGGQPWNNSSGHGASGANGGISTVINGASLTQYFSALGGHGGEAGDGGQCGGQCFQSVGAGGRPGGYNAFGTNFSIGSGAAGTNGGQGQDTDGGNGGNGGSSTLNGAWVSHGGAHATDCNGVSQSSYDQGWDGAGGGGGAGGRSCVGSKGGAGGANGGAGKVFISYDL